MALLWEQKRDGITYQVRQAGGSMRLYTNGVLHSQYNPSRKVTSSVWDLLTLPALFRPEGQIQRVLVLGVGGGAVLHQLSAWVKPNLIVGVELNEQHMYVAKRFFKLDGPNMVLYQDDARAWLSRYSGPPFDMIVDDLYAEDHGQPERAVELDQFWCTCLSQHLGDSGMVVVNTISWQELKQSAFLQEQYFRDQFASRYRLVTPTCDNAVGVFSKVNLKKSFFNQRLQAIGELMLADRSGLLRYQMRKLS